MPTKYKCVDSDFWDKYYPPNGWGCRCTVVAVPKDDPDFPVRDAQGSTINGKEVFPTPAYEIFKTNTAKDRKVFPDKHPYMPKGCGNCKFKGGKMTLSGYDPAKTECQVCNVCRALYSNRANNHVDSQTKKQIRAAVTQYPDKHFPLVTEGGDTFRQIEISKDGLTLKVRKRFFKETISKSIRGSQFVAEMECLTNLDQWIYNATYNRIEHGIDHDCEFIVYDAFWHGYAIEFKAMVTSVGYLVYTMRIK